MHMINGERIVFDVPDETIVEILSRIPAEDVVRLRTVCKKWRDLTWTHYFTRLHMQRCLPMQLYEQTYFSPCFRLDHYLLDHWWESPPQTRPKGRKLRKPSEFNLLFSNGGLVVMRNPSTKQDYRIINFMYHENVEIKLSIELRSSDVYGVFFHPSLQEFCTLWKITVSGPLVETQVHKYKILNLGSKPCWRVINNPWSDLPRVTCIPPVLIGEHLYWVVKSKPDSKWSFPADIMEFDIRTEEFNFIHSPVPGAYHCKELNILSIQLLDIIGGNELNINLLDIGGLLSFVWTSPYECPPSNKPFEVRIWTLKDRGRKLWTMCSYSINTGGRSVYGNPMALVNDELLLHYPGMLFTCNLKLGIVRSFMSERNEYAFSVSHVMSLVSLRNCKSKIYMDKAGELQIRKERNFMSKMYPYRKWGFF